MTDVLIVTGGSRGIGAAIASKAAAAGYAVCLTYSSDIAAANRVLAEIEQLGGRATAIQGRIEDPDFAPAVFDHADRTLGPVTALVNNAGITGPLGRFEDAPQQTLREVIDTNVLGTMAFAQQAIRRWKGAGIAGRMCNLSSVAATSGAAGEYVHYAASKAAIEALTVGLAKELARDGIRVNAVSPGTTNTLIHARAGEPGRPARIAPMVPMGRVGEPDEIAQAVVWLLSREASYVTGAVLRVAGGL
jgi:NAD(P)-dependent dehydrogenase (short-subunit alcohol dehydrogenase family)